MSELEKMVDSSGSDYRLLTATAIDDLGQIVVQAHKVSTNTDTAVLLTPTTGATDTVTITAATSPDAEADAAGAGDRFG